MGKDVAIKAVNFHDVAGYRTISWKGVQPDLNFIVGENGAGKSTLLKLLSHGLTFVGGKRTDDVFGRTHQTAAMEMSFTNGLTTRIQVVDSHQSAGQAKELLRTRVLQVAENRQPKNKVGIGRTNQLDNPIARYHNTLSELRGIADEEPALFDEVLALAQKVPVSPAESWEWIRREMLARGQKQERPTSCGQFDILAISLDLIRLKRDLAAEPANVFVMLDNPDAFLHPVCQEPLLALIRDTLAPARPQIFVASHSLRLLVGREPKGVFWLSRRRIDAQGSLILSSVRDLPDATKSLFFELYGDDVSASVLRLLAEIEGPEYFKFLRECALPPEVIERETPATDRQMVALKGALDHSQDEWSVLDFGAGAGDLLKALAAYAPARPLTYFAVNEKCGLQPLIDELIASGRIEKESREVTRLADLEEPCDTIVMANCCHEIPFKPLSMILSEILGKHLRRSRASRLIVHEMETLPSGEARFIMWTPRDYADIFIEIPQVVVEEVPFPGTHGVPLRTTMIRWSDPEATIPGNVESLLASSFARQLEVAKERSLDEVESLLPPVTSAGPVTRFSEAMRQRRVAFLLAQVATIDLSIRRVRTRRYLEQD